MCPASKEPERPEPAGFGNCGECAYAQTGTARICYTCATQTLTLVDGPRCAICDSPQDTWEQQCANIVCKWDGPENAFLTDDIRYFDCVFAIAHKTGALERAIKRYKYDKNAYGWGAVFGRVLVGYLNANAERFEDVDLIVASPGYGNRSHTEMILLHAFLEDDRDWPFDVHDQQKAIIKTAETKSMVDAGKWRGRWELATGDLRNALEVPDPSRVEGQDILVFDDVFTEGLTINEVARALHRAGATSTREVVLARALYGK